MWPDRGIEPGTSGSTIRRAIDCATQSCRIMRITLNDQLEKLVSYQYTRRVDKNIYMSVSLVLPFVFVCEFKYPLK